MRKKLFFLLAISLVGFSNCNEDGELDLRCVTDIAVQTLSAPGRVLSGDVIGVVCILKNVATTIDNCNDPSPSAGQGLVQVSRGYSATPKERFSEFELIDSEVMSFNDLAPGEEFIDDTMKIQTSRGPGYYAMKVEALHPDDDNIANNALAVSIEAN